MVVSAKRQVFWLVFGLAMGISTALAAPKVGVLLVNHGSRSENWRKALLSLDANNRQAIVAGDLVQGVKTAFMEYTEPSIATRLKEFDKEGYSDVVLVPVFLTVSGHTFDDIPTIIGQKADPQALQAMKLEKIERYVPAAKTHLAPKLDFTSLLETNAVRRLKKMSALPAEEGVAFIAYGDTTYEKEWIWLMHKLGSAVKQDLGIDLYTWAWCGHIAHYQSAPTTKAVQEILAKKKRALVIPVLVSFDEMFQVKIIGGGVSAVKDHQSRVAYTPDSILQDPLVDQWVVSISRKMASEIRGAAK